MISIFDCKLKKMKVKLIKLWLGYEIEIHHETARQWKKGFFELQNLVTSETYIFESQAFVKARLHKEDQETLEYITKTEEKQ